MSPVPHHRGDLVLVAYALVVAAARVVVVLADVGFSPVLVAASVLVMPTLWALKHNAIHHPIFVSRGVDGGFLVVLALLTGTASSWTSVVHCDVHHPLNNGPDDWTTVTQAPRFRWRMLRVMAYPFVVAARLWRERNRHLAGEPALARRVLVETAAIVALVLSALLLAPVAALWYVIVPMVFGQWFLIAMNYLQHADGTVGAPLEHTVNDTGRLFNLVLLNLGYHAAHHLYPGAHWTELPELHRRHVAGVVDPRFNRSNFARRLMNDVVLSVERRPLPPRADAGAPRRW